jgi:hypothetical protein
MIEQACTREDFAAAERLLLDILSSVPVDTTGETHYLLGLACFHQEKWSDAVRFLRPSGLNIQHPLAPALLERVETILATAVDRAVDPLPDFNPKELRSPAAHSLRKPQLSGEPVPPERNPLMRMLRAALGCVGGVLAAVGVFLAWRSRDKNVIFDFQSWDRRSRLWGLLEIGGRRDDLVNHRLHSTYQGGLAGGQAPGQRRPPWTERFRTATGAWNTDDPMEGAAGTEVQRSGSPLAERDDRSADASLPSPREVSRWLLATLPNRSRVEAPFVNLLTIAWIQAQLHDWVSHRPEDKEKVRFEPVPLEPDDPLRIRYGIDALQVPRSAVNPLNGAKPLTYLSEVTHWWDASHIYGSDEDTLERLRAPCGKLKIEGDLLPKHPGTGIEDTGFARNWWIGLDLMHTLFVRHHNYICDRLKEGEKREWTSDELFHTARLINAAIMAKIQTVEWTPAVLANRKVVFGMETNWWGMLQARFRRVAKRKIHTRWEPLNYVIGGIAGGKRENYGKAYAMTEEFTEVYRLHAGLPDKIRLKPLDGASPPEPPVPTEKTRGTAARGMVQKHGMAMLFNSFGHQHMPALVHNNYPAFMCGMTVPGQPVIDMGTIDIYRARERGVPPYNEFRRLLGLKPITCFAELGCRDDTVKTLEKLYGASPEGVEKLDLLAGTSCELSRAEGFGFSETMFTVFIQMASRRLQADPFYTDKFNHRYYTKTGMALIEKATMKSVLLQHYPELGQAGLWYVENAFEPWGTNAREHPEEHPLAAIVNY